MGSIVNAGIDKQVIYTGISFQRKFKVHSGKCNVRLFVYLINHVPVSCQ